MTLKDDQERATTQMKLARLAERFRTLFAETGGDEELREITMDSLRRTMNQLQEEVAVYDAHHPVVGGSIRS